MNIAGKVRELVADELQIEIDKVTLGAFFYEDLGCSLDIIEIFMRCEEEFCIEIGDEESSEIETVGQLIDVVKKKLNDKPLIPGHINN